MFNSDPQNRFLSAILSTHPCKILILLSDLDAFVKAMQANQKEKDDKKDGDEEKMEH